MYQLIIKLLTYKNVCESVKSVLEFHTNFIVF
jgi:hypothetical protein